MLFRSGVRITSCDGRNLTTNATINGSSDLSRAIVYIYKNDTSKTYWQFMGEYQPRAEVKEENPQSPFYVNGTVGNIRIVLSGGEYDNISTSELALQRAQYELYTRCRLNDSLSLTCVPIYWLDVNWLIAIKLPTEDSVKYFVTKEITISNGVTATQTVQMASFYNFYPTLNVNRNLRKRKG